MTEGVTIIIPTFNGGDIIKKNIEALATQEYLGNKELIVIDSGSTDGTYEVVLNSGAKVKRIDQKKFHHSRSRNEAVKMAKYSKVIMLVQDAIPISRKWLSKLVDSLNSQDVVAAYGQQVPHLDAGLFARFESDLYSAYLGEVPTVQSIESVDEFMRLPYHEALRKIRLNNVCAIYQRKHLLETPFPDLTFGEDIAWALEIMKKGYKIRYEPDIKVFHSHNRNADYRFRRAIIETIVCSHILGKVEEDLSSLTAKDIDEISENIKSSARKLHYEIEQKAGSKKANPSVQNLSLLKRIPYFKQMVHKAMTTLNKLYFRKVLIYSMKQIHELQLRHILQLIQFQYPSKVLVTDLQSVIDQAAESLRGRMFGLVYASHKIQGNVPYEIECMVVPHLRGV